MGATAEPMSWMKGSGYSPTARMKNTRSASAVNSTRFASPKGAGWARTTLPKKSSLHDAQHVEGGDHDAR